MRNDKRIKIENFSLNDLEKDQKPLEENSATNDADDIDIDSYLEQSYLEDAGQYQNSVKENNFIYGTQKENDTIISDSSHKKKNDSGFGDFVMACLMIGLVGTPLLLLGSSCP
jgi:hypothetical protein